jgi:hypothetical protein
MDWQETRQFVRRWLWYTIRDAFAQTFGWLTLFGTSFGGLILAKFGISATNSQLFTVACGSTGVNRDSGLRRCPIDDG